MAPAGYDIDLIQTSAWVGALYYGLWKPPGIAPSVQTRIPGKSMAPVVAGVQNGSGSMRRDTSRY